MQWVRLTCAMYEAPDPSEILDGFPNGLPIPIRMSDVEQARENLEQDMGNQYLRSRGDRSFSNLEICQSAILPRETGSSERDRAVALVTASTKLVD